MLQGFSNYHGGGFQMNVDVKVLEAKLREMYPEIDQHDLGLSLQFDDRKNAWIVRFHKDQHELTTHLEKKDAEECLEGIKCVYLGVQVGQFVKNFEATAAA
jgi:hypothetical protein